MNHENRDLDVWDSLIAGWEYDMAPDIETSGVDISDWHQAGLSGNGSPAQDLSSGTTNASADKSQTDASGPSSPPTSTETAGHTALQDDIEKLKRELSEKSQVLAELVEYVDTSLQPWTVAMTDTIKELTARCERLEEHAG